MDVNIITCTEEFLVLKQDWERLEKQSPDVTYYSGFEYDSTWWAAYKGQSNLALFIIVVRQNGKIVGIAPLIIEKVKKRFFEYRVLKFLGRGDYLDFLIDFSLPKPQTVIKDIFNFIEKKRTLWDQIDLTHLNQYSSLTLYLFKSKAYNKYLKTLIETPYLKIDNFSSFEELRSNVITSSTQRMYNRFNKKFSYKFMVIEENNSNIYDEMAELHKKEQSFLKGEKRRNNRYSLFANKLRERFTREIYLKSDRIITFLIISEDKIVCYDSCYLYKNTLFSWNMAYDPDYYEYRLGKIINYEIFKYLIQKGKSYTFDFGSGRYPWKFEWTNTFNLVYELKYSNPDNKKLKIYNKIKRIKKAIKP